ncbi:MAG: MlaD family protein [Rickettsiales bacterium]|jgi:phospholipid/cholesterol/gamma-HCH transport system substrate-binding protein|nr:MlaD family protein [Rickettsiales bacterium]
MAKKTAKRNFFSTLFNGLKDIIKNEKPLDTIAGLFVIFVAVFFLVWSFSKADLKKVSGYELTGVFAQTGGVKNGADVIINGVKVGSIKSIDIDKNDYSVIIKFSIENRIKIPADSVAQITAYGLMGDKYVKINIGKDENLLNAGDEVKTKSFQSLEEQIGQILFSKD